MEPFEDESDRISTMSETQLRAFVRACAHGDFALDKNLFVALLRLEEIDFSRATKRDEQAISSLEIAAKAAQSSKDSAKWTMVAAWIAAGSAVISLAGVIIPPFHKDEPQKTIVQVPVQQQPVAKPAAVKPHPNE